MLNSKEITESVELGNITIDPFDPKQVGPNSYDVRLGESMCRVVPNALLFTSTRKPGKVKPCKRFMGGFLLWPGRVYLGHTMERVGSNYFVPCLHGRSSVARHGLMVHLTAGFGDVGFLAQWVLEIVNCNPFPVMLFPGDRVAQFSFDRVAWGGKKYDSTYQGQDGVVGAKSLDDWSTTMQ